MFFCKQPVIVPLIPREQSHSADAKTISYYGAMKTPLVISRSNFALCENDEEYELRCDRALAHYASRSKNRAPVSGFFLIHEAGEAASELVRLSRYAVCR